MCSHAYFKKEEARPSLLSLCYLLKMYFILFVYRCSECLSDNACGWCSVNKICRGISTDCRSSSSITFLQVCIINLLLLIV